MEGKTNQLKIIFLDVDGVLNCKKTTDRINGYQGIEDKKVSFIPLLLIAPRIPFPPMDYFLGIDFVISNFLNKKEYQKLQSEPNYKRLIKKSQEKMWKPYYSILANNWSNTSFRNVTPHMLNPMLVS